MAVRVLVVDDSSVIRTGLRADLSAFAGIEVTTAPDPLVARKKMERSLPDVVLLDLEMPRMHGMTFLRQLMRSRPLPVIIYSSHTPEGGKRAMEALEAGAVDVVSKPDVDTPPREATLKLVDSIRAAARSRPRSSASEPTPCVTPAVPTIPFLPLPGSPVLVAIGASTGGTQALAALLRRYPVNAPATVIVEHMPAGFTRSFAERLDAFCPARVSEAEGGEVLEPGHVLIAPGDRHLLVRRVRDELRAEVKAGPPVSRHRPSVNVLFKSVARSAGANAIGVLLTGMGADGAEGLLEMAQVGAATIAQDEASCVVFGMPKQAIELGAARFVLPLDRIASRILQLAALPASPPQTLRAASPP